MTDEAKALVEWLRDEAGFACEKAEAGNLLEAADLIETQAREIERLRLEVEKHEALHVSAYHAGLKAGWNFGVGYDNVGMRDAMESTEHIKELRRIREARAALGESYD